MDAKDDDFTHPLQSSVLRLRHDALLRLFRLLELVIDVPQHIAEEGLKLDWCKSPLRVSSSHSIRTVCVADREHMTVDELLLQRDLDIEALRFEMDRIEDMDAITRLRLREEFGLNHIVLFVQPPPISTVSTAFALHSRCHLCP